MDQTLELETLIADSMEHQLGSNEHVSLVSTAKLRADECIPSGHLINIPAVVTNLSGAHRFAKSVPVTSFGGRQHVQLHRVQLLRVVARSACLIRIGTADPQAARVTKEVAITP